MFLLKLKPCNLKQTRMYIIRVFGFFYKTNNKSVGAHILRIYLTCPFEVFTCFHNMHYFTLHMTMYTT